jgi:PAS domain-containing protein
MEMDPAQFADRLVSGISDAIVYADAEGVIRLWNQGACRIFGFAEAEALGRSLDIIIPAGLRELALARLSRHDAHRALALRRRTGPVGAGCAEGWRTDLCRIHHRAGLPTVRTDDRHRRRHA